MLTEKIMVIAGLTIAVASLLLAAATHVNGIAAGLLVGLGLVLWAERD
jgi:hypothetical protein